MSIQIVRECVHRLLNDDVIDNTFGLMNRLKAALHGIAVRKNSLNGSEKMELISILSPLSSESIREALHKHELKITNEIIVTKNIILRTCGVEPDEFHQPIDASKYAHGW
jgi:hypothetical protein